VAPSLRNVGELGVLCSALATGHRPVRAPPFAMSRRRSVNGENGDKGGDLDRGISIVGLKIDAVDGGLEIRSRPLIC
jgi:hypothetical protein